MVLRYKILGYDKNLGPLLFIIFINDLCDVFKCGKLLFAENFKLFCEVNNFNDCVAVQYHMFYRELVQD